LKHQMVSRFVVSIASNRSKPPQLTAAKLRGDVLIFFLLPLIVVCVLRKRQFNQIKAFRTQRTPGRLATLEYG
jgi:hypothetical protein